MGREENVEIILSVLATLMAFGPLLAYYRVLTESFKNARRSTLVPQINSSRTALFLPMYTVAMYFSMVIPALFLPLQVTISIAEGYSFLSFFAMIVDYLGGPNRAVEKLQSKFNEGKKPLFPCCCPDTGLTFYSRTLRALYHFIITRTGFVLIAVILQMIMKYAVLTQSQHIGVQVMSIIFQLVALGFLVNAFLSLVFFFEMIYEHTLNLHGISKIWLLKFSVGLIVIQGLIEQFLFDAHVLDIKDSSNYSAEDRAQMIYCFVVLCEYFLLSYFFYWAYSKGIQLPSDTSPTEDGFASDQKHLSTGTGGDVDPIPENSEQVDIPFTEYLSRVFTVSNTLANLDPGDTLKQRLTGDDGQVEPTSEA